MHIWKKPLELETINSRGLNTMIEVLGITFIEIGDDFLVARMPVNEKTKQPFGIMHGGASCTLAETVGSHAAYLTLEEGEMSVGLDINTNHIRSISSGFVIGTAKPFHLGSSTQVWGINITDENQKLISVSRLTVAILQEK